MANCFDITTVYNTYVDNLRSYGIHLGFDEHVVMDAIHDIFCKLCAEKTSFDSVVSVKCYLFKVLRNRLVDICRRQKECVDISELEQVIPFEIKVTIEDDLIISEDRERLKALIEEMLQSLTNRQREIIYLRYVMEYDYKDISDLMNISIPACHKLVSKSMLTLREKYAFLLSFFLSTSL